MLWWAVLSLNYVFWDNKSWSLVPTCTNSYSCDCKIVHMLIYASDFIFMQLLFREWPNVLSLLAGLIAIKTLIITAIGPRVGLTLQESVRIGLLLSQGGEFGFVVFSLANR